MNIYVQSVLKRLNRPSYDNSRIVCRHMQTVMNAWLNYVTTRDENFITWL